MAITKASSSAVAPAAKGDLVAGSATNDSSVLTVGANDTVLTADSTAATGLKWAAPAAAGDNFSLLNSGGTALSGSSTVTVSGISGKNKIMILVESASDAVGQGNIFIRLNGDTGYNYAPFGMQLSNPSSYAADSLSRVIPNENGISLGTMTASVGSAVSGYVLLNGCNTSGVKIFNSAGAPTPSGSNTGVTRILGGYYNSATVITSISVASANNFDAGTVFVYTSA